MGVYDPHVFIRALRVSVVNVSLLALSGYRVRIHHGDTESTEEEESENAA